MPVLLVLQNYVKNYRGKKSKIKVSKCTTYKTVPKLKSYTKTQKIIYSMYKFSFLISIILFINDLYGAQCF